MRKKFIHIAGSILIGTLIGIYISYQLENYIDNYYVIIDFLEKIQANKNFGSNSLEACL